jgi:hypothetical protein
MELVLNIRENVHIVCNKIISYETEVAIIGETEIVKMGKFSRTTGRHITLVSELLGKPVVESSKRIEFDKLHYGAKCRYHDSLSISTSCSIIDELATGVNLMTACARVWPGLRGKDRSKIEEYYSNSYRSEEWERLVVMVSLGILITDEPADLSKISV